jgi:inorganic pyrophosphatase
MQVAFFVGALTSIASGFIGMKIAVFANGRVAKAAVGGIGRAFLVAFKAGSVMGFALVSLGVLMLFITIQLFKLKYSGSDLASVQSLYEAVAGFGLGGSTVGLFARVGGGIYTKAADVGADLVGKVEKNIPEDDPRNPAVIAEYAPSFFFFLTILRIRWYFIFTSWSHPLPGNFLVQQRR